MRDYSQFGEQAVILRHAGADGAILDVGAWNATVFSNSRALLERGWRGVLMEPHPAHAEHLRQAYAEWPDVQVLEEALGLEAGIVPMYISDDAVSTFHAATHVKWSEQGGYAAEPLLVRVATWDAIWDWYGPFEVVSLDAEGWSVPLLRRMLRHEYRPRVVVCEYDDELHGICRAMRRAGYRIRLLNGTNIVWSLQ